MEALLAEDLLLLLLDDTSGRFASGSHHQQALVAAALVELDEQGVVELTAGRGLLRRGVVRVVRPRQDGDAVLAELVARVQEKERPAQTLVERLGGDLERALLERLAARGLIRQEQGRLLGIFPRTAWPATDVSYEQQVRARVRSVLVDGAAPDHRTALLVGLLAAVGQAHKVIDRGDRSAREVRHRAADVTPDSWPIEALKKAVAAAAAAATATGSVVSDGGTG